MESRRLALPARGAEPVLPGNWPARAQGTTATCSSTATAHQRGTAQQAVRLGPLAWSSSNTRFFQVSRRLPPHPAQLAERSPIADLRRRRALRAAWAWRSFVVQRGLRQHSPANGSARETGLDGASRRWRRPPRDESDGELTEPEASYAQSMKQAVGARRAAAWLPPGQPWLLLQPPTPS